MASFRWWDELHIWAYLLKKSLYYKRNTCSLSPDIVYWKGTLVRKYISVDIRKRVINTMELDHNSHSVFLLYYHLVMVIKYRRKVRNGKISERAKEIFEYIAPGYGIVLEEWNHDADHVHVMFRAQPKTELSKFINAYKSASSRLLKLLSAPCRRGADWNNTAVYRKPGWAKWTVP